MKKQYIEPVSMVFQVTVGARILSTSNLDLVKKDIDDYYWDED